MPVYDHFDPKQHDDVYDVIIIGCGLSGAVLAERYANVLGRKVLILEKRDHIAGNCYDYVDAQSGILMNKYGAHLFHTNDEGVLDYIQPFADWVRWEHKVLAHVDQRLVSVPVNITTVNEICGTHLRTQSEMEVWLAQNQIMPPSGFAQNGEEMALSRVGPMLYEKIFKHYTIKQWNKDPSELAPEVLARIPIRANHDTRYFDDKYQALPREGYTKFVEKILASPNITVCLNTNYFDVVEFLEWRYALIFTGPVDHYFAAQGLPSLEYRSLEFQVEHHMITPFYQPASVVNYPGRDTPFTRIVEYKHFLHQTSPHTVIVKEVSTDSGEPYYPVLNEKNKKLYEQYKQLADAEGVNGVVFVGRLANFKYFNMDAAIRNALDTFEKMNENVDTNSTTHVPL